MSVNLLLVFWALLLVLLNGFFVAAEFSLVKLRITRVHAIAKSLGWRGRVLARVHSDLDAYLSACQLGITLTSLGLGWVGEPAFAALIESALEPIGVTNQKLIHGIAFVTAFFTISYLHIVLICCLRWWVIFETSSDNLKVNGLSLMMTHYWGKEPYPLTR